MMKSNFHTPKSPCTPQHISRTPSIMVNTEAPTTSGFLATTTLDLGQYLRKNNESHVNKAWVNHLDEKPLLELMHQTLPEDNNKNINPSQLNCYERLKKLLVSQSCTQTPTKSQSHSKLLDNVAVFQDKINKMENEYRDKVSRKSAKGSRYVKSHILSQNQKSGNTDKFNPNKSMSIWKNSSLKKNVPKQNKHSEKQAKIMMHPSIKKMMNEFKQSCCEKFINHKKVQNDKVLDELDEKLSQKIQKKFSQVLKYQFKEFFDLEDQKINFDKIILEKNLEIQSLKKQMNLMEDRVLDLETQKQPQKQKNAYRKNVQQFHDEYLEIFGDLSLEQLRKKFDFMEKIFLDKHAVEEEKHLDFYQNLRKQYEENQKHLKNKIQKLEEQNTKLMKTISEIRKYQNLDNSYQKHEIYQKITQYRLKSQQLQNLHKFIFNKYIEWTQQKDQGQTKILSLLQSNKVQNYQEMITTIVDFNKNYGNTSKTVESMTKLLGMIQKLKKIISPSKCYEKLVPMKVLQDVENILKNISLHKRRTKKQRTYYDSKVRQDNQYIKQTLQFLF